MEPIYLDYNATTPIDRFVAKAMQPYLDLHFGNPSSLHIYGATSKMAVEKARKQVASLLNARPDEIVFTSGGTESNNFAIKGGAIANRAKGNHIITSGIEHPAVIEVCRYLETQGFSITYLPVDEFGMVDPADVEDAITPATILISIMHANNETGTIQPLEIIGKIAREHEILMHTDAAQSVGKIPVDVESLNVDLLSVAGHKLYAPKGIGALYIRRGVKIEKLIHGADHEANRRAGTENVPEIVGLGAAAGIRYPISSIRYLRDKLYQSIKQALPEIRLNGHPELRLPNTLSIGFPDVEAAILLNEMKGIAASAGAACHSDQSGISGVLMSMSVPPRFAIGTIRFSVGRMTTEEEIEKAIPIIVDAYRSVKIENNHTFIQEHDDGFDIVQPENISSEEEAKIQDPGSSIQHPASSIRLTEFTHSLGCACKIRPQLLEKILKNFPHKNNPAILVGHETSDDAAVFQIDEKTAIVQTVDFIPPVVNDPYAYGAIAAANALSDIYAMGGTPLFALSIVGFPENKLPVETLQEIIRGANDKVAEAGIQIIGGHSIDDGEPKFGLVVTGRVDPNKIYRNNTAKPGDVLILTKPLGTGIITTAIKRGLADLAETRSVTILMSELNRKASEIMGKYTIDACTDVTGFGLLGHLLEMVKGCGISAELFADNAPVLPGVWNYIAANVIPGGTLNNMKFVENAMEWDQKITDAMKIILADAQTSGGLLIALPPKEGKTLLNDFNQNGLPEAAYIGVFTDTAQKIRVIGKRAGF
ncbi:MAG: selenide, water dikinase SelD [Bacteroidales bacterium]|jgi:cysteine desulfurase NifS/selenium donor protein|nr:selenide, water dikinase SelD [Bacteroidales bacterium]